MRATGVSGVFEMEFNGDGDSNQPVRDPYGIKARREALLWDDGSVWTQDDVAALAGCAPQDVGALERGERSNSKHLNNILDVLAKAERGAVTRTARRILPRKQRRSSRFSDVPSVPAVVEMKIYAMQPNGKGGMMMSDTGTKMRIPRSMLNIPDPYAVRFWGSGMFPKYLSGDILLINPIAPPRPQGGVIVMNEDREDVHIGEFIVETADEWTIAQFGVIPGEKRPAYAEKAIPRADYPLIHAIVGVSTDLI